MRIQKYPRIIQDARTSKNTAFLVVPAMASFNLRIFANRKKQQQKSCKDRNLWHRWHHLLQHIAMSVVSLLDWPWEPNLLEQIGMDVRGQHV